MKRSVLDGRIKWLTFSLVFICCCTLLAGGYQLYQMSIEQAVYSTTVSFMEQIADHDHLNIINQMNNKWEYLASVLERIKVTRNITLQDVLYNLSVESRTTSFDKLYLVTDDGRVFSSSYVESTLQNMPWDQEYQKSENNFVTRYNESSRENWGEYLVYGINLEDPIPCENENISGIIGLVPISEIDSQMRLESFDGRGIAIVMQPTGEIITASQNYNSSSYVKNYITVLQDAEFKNGGSVEACRYAMENGNKLFVEYNLNGEGFYALFQPMEHHGGTDWYLVVQVSEQVTAEQVRTLIFRSVPFFIIIGSFILIVTYFVYHSLNAARIARASEQAKSVFLANMSHEIRTPLNGIVGLHYLMRQNIDDKEKLKDYLSKAEVSAEFLKSVITDVLDMSKIESGQLEIYRNEMDLSLLVWEIKVLLDTQAREKELLFKVDCNELYHPFVIGDALRVKQILTNLLGNALKFTPKGGEISLTVRQEFISDNVNTTFIVSDTGCGMSPEFLERIWIPFEQERRVTSQNGTGLGTTLSKTLVEKMGGSIDVESRVGEGTVFTVVIPFTVVQTPESPADIVNADDVGCHLNGKRILVAEDNEINRMIVASIMQSQGCELTEAVNGEEAVAAFEKSSPYYFDLVLMDVQMPVMDGYEATRRIRALIRSDASDVPIFAITANAFREDVEKALQVGMNDVVTKPLDVSLLMEKIRNLKNWREGK